MEGREQGGEEGEKRRNESGPDQVREEIDTSDWGYFTIHLPG